jgi:rhodanese-related sulfurtransferase
VKAHEPKSNNKQQGNPMTQMTPITPERAAELIRYGAVLVDIRERDEYAREKIAGARHHAVSILDREHPARAGDEVLIFHCKSGGRTRQHAERIAGGMPSGLETYILDGGIDAWKKAGMPVALDRKAPMPTMRQVQIVAGSLVVLGTLLGVTVAPGFYALSAFVGIGLVLAGVTGFCGMERILALMPWNRNTASA